MYPFAAVNMADGAPFRDGRHPLSQFLSSLCWVEGDGITVEHWTGGSRAATAAALVHELIEARDEKRLLRLQRQLAGYKLLIIDELGYVPLSTTGAELLFEVFSQRYERGSTIVTSNLPFDEWTGVFGSERLTGALLDRLTHHVHILEMNGDSYRLKQSKRRQRQPQAAELSDTQTQA
jgi:chromosomal replication initiation ATPase DnaA